jgi:ferrochelatase
MSRYRQEPAIAAGQPPCTGILLTNLGTPDAPTVPALRRYLAEFLFDPRVIERPRLLWWLVLHGVILRVRPRRAAHAYNKVWTDQGSPLMAISRHQEAALQQRLDARLQPPVKVALAMRYGNPSIQTGLEVLKAANVRRLLVLPLYPQYSATTTASTLDAVADVLRTWRLVPELRVVNGYFDENGYIDALAGSIRRHWQEHGQGERLLFSFHGLPKSYADAGDPYPEQCRRTAELVAQALQLPAERWHLAFQSRFGPQEWLQPYTDHTLKEWGTSGVKRIEVISPGFSADCLETLEEIAITNRELFQEAGGEDYHYIPALNDSAEHMDFLADLVVKHCQGWEVDSIGGD